MKSLRVVSLVAALSFFGVAQQANQVITPTSSQVVVPRLLRFAGQVKDATGSVGITFTLHKSQQDNSALWIESQNVKLDAAGKYTVLLGATKPDGIPTELFTSGEAQWLSIRVEGQPEQARVLLVSVPYALKAAEAETLAGHAATEFVTTDKLNTTVEQKVQSHFNTSQSKKNSVNGVLTSTATNFTDNTTNQVVGVTQNGTGKGLVATAVSNTAIYGNTTAATGSAVGVYGQSSSSGGVGLYGLASSKTGNPVALFGSTPATSGIAIAADETATTGGTTGLQTTVYSPTGVAAIIQNKGGGKLFSGRSGASNTEVFAVDGAGNTTSAGQFVSTVATGTAPLAVSSTTQVANLNASQLGGVGASGFAQLGTTNTFTVGQIIDGASVISGTNESGPMLTVGNSGDSFSSAITATNGGQYGIGISASASSDGDGIEGFGTQTAGSIGVLGALANSNGFSNSFFLLESDDGLDSGIWADGANGQEAALIATSDDLSAGIFFNDSSASSTILVLNNYSGGPTGNGPETFGSVLRAEGPGGVCGISEKGSIACTGQVKTLAATQNGTRQVETYSVQSAENWLEDYGSGRLSHGGATIQLEPTFADTVNTGVDFHVFLTPGGDCKGLYVTNKTANSFEVHELGGGTTSIPFDYKIVAKRRGHETERLVDVTDRMQSEATAAHFRRLPQSLPRKKMMGNGPTVSTAKTGIASTRQLVGPHAVPNTPTVLRRPETVTP